MERPSSIWLWVGEWLLSRRWLWVGLASLSVFIFEFLEYRPLEQGLESSFFFEIIFYGVILPLSTGMALTWLAASRTELAWSTYYQNLIPNLALQLQNTHTYDELSEVFLQFVRVVIPVAGVTLYKYEQNGLQPKLVLNWSLDKSLPLPDSSFACATDVCPFLPTQGDSREVIRLELCRDPNLVVSSRKTRFYCLPFLFSNSIIAGARLYFPSNRQPSPEQSRLLKEIAPSIASAFHRIQLERLVKERDESISAEQRRIARDVHDTLGNSLAYLRLRLDQINMEFNQTQMNIFQPEVEALRDVAKEAYDQMRQVLVTLSPNGSFNLSDTLVKYSERISQRSNFEVHVHQMGRPRALSALIQRNIFYIYQEALTNIEKHAHACQVELKLIWQETDLRMEVMDNGVGYETSLEVPNGHYGLSNMNERALESNGKLSISSQPGHGTCLTLSIPYEGKL